MSEIIYDIPVQKISGEATTLGEFKGKVLLVVNVASKCGLTPQYEGLEKLYERFKGQGLVIAGFPANDFKEQEPGTDGEIASFCSLNYGVDFPMFSQDHSGGRGETSAVCGADQGATCRGEREYAELAGEADGVGRADTRRA